nr:hypothetical protein [Paenibacillus dendritiformis]
MRGEAAIEEFEEQFRAYGFDQAYSCRIAPRRAATAGSRASACSFVPPRSMGSIWRDAPSLEMLATPTLMTAHQVEALKIMVRTGWGEGSLTAFKHR